MFVLGGVTRNTKCNPVLSNKRLLAFSKGHNTKTASVGGSPKNVKEWDRMGYNGMGWDGVEWDSMGRSNDGMMRCEENVGHDKTDVVDRMKASIGDAK